MPNYCENVVIINGKESDLTTIFEAKLSFQKLYPRPAEKDEDWYDWNCEHWGTKWDINEDDITITLNQNEVGGFEIEADFVTAWAPPIAFFKYLTKQMTHLQVRLKYYEGGMDFCGETIFANGKMSSWDMDEDEKIQFIRNNFYEDYLIDDPSDDEDDTRIIPDNS